MANLMIGEKTEKIAAAAPLVQDGSAPVLVGIATGIGGSISGSSGSAASVAGNTGRRQEDPRRQGGLASDGGCLVGFLLSLRDGDPGASPGLDIGGSHGDGPILSWIDRTVGRDEGFGWKVGWWWFKKKMEGGEVQRREIGEIELESCMEQGNWRKMERATTVVPKGGLDLNGVGAEFPDPIMG